ncbi:MAG: hypothetical protein ACK5CA_05915 [Cyanobacteriota bacterium]|jgi:hypothetical protein
MILKMMMSDLRRRSFSPSPALVLSSGAVGFGKDWLAPYSGAGLGLTSPLSGAYGAEVLVILRRGFVHPALLVLGKICCRSIAVLG